MGGRDILIGGPGDDELHGEGGDDQLIGGPGKDVLDGGPGTKTGDDALAPNEGFAMGVRFDLHFRQDVVLSPGPGTDCTRNLAGPQLLVAPGDRPYQALFYIEHGWFPFDSCGDSAASAHYTIAGRAHGAGDIWWVANGPRRVDFHVDCIGDFRCDWRQQNTQGVLIIS